METQEGPALSRPAFDLDPLADCVRLTASQQRSSKSEICAAAISINCSLRFVLHA